MERLNNLPDWLQWMLILPIAAAVGLPLGIELAIQVSRLMMVVIVWSITGQFEWIEIPR